MIVGTKARICCPFCLSIAGLNRSFRTQTEHHVALGKRTATPTRSTYLDRNGITRGQSFRAVVRHKYVHNLTIFPASFPVVRPSTSLADSSFISRMGTYNHSLTIVNATTDHLKSCAANKTFLLLASHSHLLDAPADCSRGGVSAMLRGYPHQ
jgi:hypothetical protein